MHRQREEILACFCFFCTYNGTKYRDFTHGCENCTGRLASDTAGFQGYGLIAILEFFDNRIHSFILSFHFHLICVRLVILNAPSSSTFIYCFNFIINAVNTSCQCGNVFTSQYRELPKNLATNFLPLEIKVPAIWRAQCTLSDADPVFGSTQCSEKHLYLSGSPATYDGS